MREAVTNTSPLQYLHQADVLDLLPRLYDRILVPTLVLAELDEGRALGVALPNVLGFSWINVVDPPAPELLPLAPDLGPGERSALAVAASRRLLVILDDALARRHAGLLGLRCTGTLGILIRAKREGHLPAIRPVLDRLEALRFRLDPATRSSALELAGE
jgi:predicted nucleic acid-binding protein